MTVSSSHEQKQYREMRERKIISKFIYNCSDNSILVQEIYYHCVNMWKDQEGILEMKWLYESIST
jgi:hypothetical protein